MTPQPRSLDEIHDAIRDAIVTGQLAPGAVVSQVKLASQLGVGRTPLREALRMLQREGLVEAETNRRIRIARFSLSDLDDLYAMRITLEALAVRMTVPRLGPADIDQLDEYLELMDDAARAADFAAWDLPHTRFHEALVAGSGDRLRRTIRQLSDHAGRYRAMKIAQEPEALVVGRAEHRAIVETCRTGDEVGAADALARHLAHTAMTLILLTSPDYDPVATRSAVASVIGATHDDAGVIF